MSDRNRIFSNILSGLYPRLISYTLVQKTLFTIFFLIILSSCKKKVQQNNTNHPVPSIPVSIVMYPNDPLYFKVQSIGGWMYLSGGINGIVLYRKSQEEFVAVERTSSHFPNDAAAKVFVQSDNINLRDSISDSKWFIFDGTVTKGPAQWALRLYGTSYDGNVLRIQN